MPFPKLFIGKRYIVCDTSGVPGASVHIAGTSLVLPHPPPICPLLFTAVADPVAPQPVMTVIPAAVDTVAPTGTKPGEKTTSPASFITGGDLGTADRRTSSEKYAETTPGGVPGKYRKMCARNTIGRETLI
jgi:hypothetical protein